MNTMDLTDRGNYNWFEACVLSSSNQGLASEARQNAERGEFVERLVREGFVERLVLLWADRIRTLFYS